VILGLMNLCFYSALARLPLGIAVTIEFLGPLAVALAGSRRWLDAFWAVLAAGGVVLLMEGGGDLDLVGVLFALAAGTFWGLYILIGAALGRHTTEGNGLALGMIVAALVAVPVGVADSDPARATRARQGSQAPDGRAAPDRATRGNGLPALPGQRRRSPRRATRP
jgi:inner membrane transporter RhtA